MQPDQKPGAIEYAYEPPASVDTSAPQSQSSLAYIVLAVCVLLLGIGLGVAAKLYGIAGQRMAGESLGSAQSETAYDSDQVTNQCFAFRLPSKQTIDEKGPTCYVSAKSYDQSVVVELLPADVTGSNLQKYAEADFTKKFPEVGDNKVGRSDYFAGRQAYSIIWNDGAKYMATYYIYNDQESVLLDGTTYRSYSVLLSGRQNLTNLVMTVNDSWQWNTVVEEQKSYQLQ